MDLEIIILSGVSQRKKIAMWECTYVKSKKNIYTDIFTKQEQIYRFREQSYGYQRGRGKKRDGLGVWDWHVHTALFKTDSQQGLSV